MRHVKGILFVDYVRMLRGHKGVDWGATLPREDAELLKAKIDPEAWYPMASFERMGNLILRHVAHNDMAAVRMWGRFSVDQLRHANPMLVAPGDPIETLNRFRVMRATFFDFDALTVPMLHDDEAQIVVHYHMGMPAEEAATLQTLGFFERLLEVAGASEVEASVRDKSWEGASRTLLTLHWRMPH